jgi:metal-dependent amidase/aminoacylase/carboxypeptidase family protein
MQNHPDAVKLIREAAGSLLGAEHVLLPEKDLGAEDFGCFSEIAPGAMFMLGARIEGDEHFGHNPRFDIDERALPKPPCGSWAVLEPQINTDKR